MKEEVLYSAGGKGARVCLVRKRGSSSLHLRWWDKDKKGGRNRTGNFAYQDLRHDDRELGEDAADQASAALRRGSKIGPTRGLTVTQLLGYYKTHRSDRKKPAETQKDLHRSGLFMQFLRDPEREAMSVDPDTMEAYVQWRREQGVSDTTIGHEIVFVRGVFDWALTKRTSDGKTLLSANPIAKVERIKSAEPKVPVADPSVFLAVYRYSDRADAQKLLRPMLMLAAEHGWRLGAWCKMRACDFDLIPTALAPYGRILKRKAIDKKGKGDWKPLTPRGARAARLLLKRAGVSGDAYLFPAPVAKRPWTNYHALDQLARAEKLATAALRRRGMIGGDEELKLGGFHALRRKWATDRKGLPLVDVADAGDWHPATLLAHYMKPDAKTTLQVTLHRG